MNELILVLIMWLAGHQQGYISDAQRELMSANGLPTATCQLFEDGSGTCEGVTLPGYDYPGSVWAN